MPITAVASADRVTSEWKLNTNPDVSTSSDTYETVYNFSGAGLLGSISIASSAGSGEAGKCIVEVTVDGGSLYEIDMATHIITTAGVTWESDSGATSWVIPIASEFKTSILVRAKNDSDTTALAVSVSSSEDQ